MTAKQIDDALDTAGTAQLSWATEDLKVRGDVLRTAAGVLCERGDQLALLVTREMGKPLAEALAEVHKCAELHIFWTYASVDADRTIVAAGVTTRIDDEHGTNVS